MAAAVAHQSIITSFPGSSAPVDWPEPIQPVQILSESGLSAVPSRYIRPEVERPIPVEGALQIPVIDLAGLQVESLRKLVLAQIANACEEWGFIQVVNHGIGLPLLQQTLSVGRQFFDLPLEEKQAYANSPMTYEGYGSRLGVEKGAVLDWGDYYFVNSLPACTRDYAKWPKKPSSWRSVIEEYSHEVANLCQTLLAAISSTLDVEQCALSNAFGDEESGLCLRVNFYPPCPQPDLTLGLSSHSDPGGITVLLQDENVEGLQVRHDGCWVTVKPLQGGLIVNLGDQIQILSNGIYKSVEHRAIVNRDKSRLSIAAFYNPSNNRVVGPLSELVNAANPARYQAMTFREYRSFIRRTGTSGKRIVESIKSPK